jgi:hypothetical protein
VSFLNWKLPANETETKASANKIPILISIPLQRVADCDAGPAGYDQDGNDYHIDLVCLYFKYSNLSPYGRNYFTLFFFGSSHDFRSSADLKSWVA